MRDSKGRFVKGHKTWNKQPEVWNTCEECGEVFKVKPCNKERRRFCSRECYWENMRGQVPWNSGLTKETDLRIKKYAEGLIGRARGGVKRHKPKTIRKMSEKRRIWHDKNDFHHSEETKRSISDTLRKLMKNADFAKRVRRNLTIKPNKYEKRMRWLLAHLGLNFKYTGDYKIWIGGLNPDFLDEENKLIIEVLGEYWHRIRPNMPVSSDPDYREGVFADEGYTPLMVWTSEFDDEEALTEKLNSFVGGERFG